MSCKAVLASLACAKMDLTSTWLASGNVSTVVSATAAVGEKPKLYPPLIDHSASTAHDDVIRKLHHHELLHAFDDFTSSVGIRLISRPK